jgi:hypothetical protein
MTTLGLNDYLAYKFLLAGQVPSQQYDDGITMSPSTTNSRIRRLREHHLVIGDIGKPIPIPETGVSWAEHGVSVTAVKIQHLLYQLGHNRRLDSARLAGIYLALSQLGPLPPGRLDWRDYSDHYGYMWYVAHNFTLHFHFKQPSSLLTIEAINKQNARDRHMTETLDQASPTQRLTHCPAFCRVAYLEFLSIMGAAPRSETGTAVTEPH